jgi:hypothetical protein
MNISQNRVFVAYLEIGENRQKLVTCKSGFIPLITAPTSAVIAYSLKIPPIMLRKVAYSCIGFRDKNEARLPLYRVDNSGHNCGNLSNLTL